MPRMYASTSASSCRPCCRLLRELRLRREERLGLRARHELPCRERDGERVVARDVERREARRPAQELEVEAAVLRRHPAGAELRVRARRPVHVRHAERVAVDRDAALRPHRRPRLRRRRARASPACSSCVRSFAVTFPCSGVSPSYIEIWLVRSGGFAPCARRQDVEREQRVVGAAPQHLLPATTRRAAAAIATTVRLTRASLPPMNALLAFARRARSPCASPGSSRGAGGRRAGPSSPPGPGRSRRMPSRRPRSPGARPRSGTAGRSASTTRAAPS